MDYQFKDTKFMTAKEKQQVIRAWDTFLKHGCKRDHFTKAIYHHLINHCSFIAHYDLAGFYSTYFDQGEDKENFLSQFDNRQGLPRSIEYGDTYWIGDGNDVCAEYYDINTEMCNVARQYLPELLHEAEVLQRNTDIARAEVLLRKHGISIATKEKPIDEVMVNDEGIETGEESEQELVTPIVTTKQVSMNTLQVCGKRVKKAQAGQGRLALEVDEL
jgi:hypothetical protein